MALYLDTSCLLKVFFPEPETARTLELISAEEQVIVSSLTRLEAFSQIHARIAGGTLSAARGGRLKRQMVAVLDLAPYEQVACISRPGSRESSSGLFRSVNATGPWCTTVMRPASFWALRARRWPIGDRGASGCRPVGVFS
jgi:hypothetical protein